MATQIHRVERPLDDVALGGAGAGGVVGTANEVEVVCNPKVREHLPRHVLAFARGRANGVPSRLPPRQCFGPAREELCFLPPEVVVVASESRHRAWDVLSLHTEQPKRYLQRRAGKRVQLLERGNGVAQVCKS